MKDLCKDITSATLYHTHNLYFAIDIHIINDKDCFAGECNSSRMQNLTNLFGTRIVLAGLRQVMTGNTALMTSARLAPSSSFRSLRTYVPNPNTYKSNSSVQSHSPEKNGGRGEQVVVVGVP